METSPDINTSPRFSQETYKKALAQVQKAYPTESFPHLEAIIQETKSETKEKTQKLKKQIGKGALKKEIKTEKTKTQKVQPQIQKIEEGAKEVEKTPEESITNEAITFMQKVIGNKELYEKDFVETKRGYNQKGKRIKGAIENPFSFIKESFSRDGIVNDLQMRDNSFIPTAYEKILTGENLKTWRKLPLKERTQIIADLNMRWKQETSK